MNLDGESCYRALLARDARFDGVFFVGVETTGVYCRPVCPARTPGRARCAFFARAAEAERAGFRACFRCRPELAPGAASTDAVPRLVHAAMAKIERGALNDGSVDDLASGLGVTARHLRRAMEAEIGVAPIELAQTRRLALAKQLLRDTSLPMTEIAYASGFSSLRRFNAAVRERFGGPPSTLRGRASVEDGATLPIRFDVRPPFDWPRMLRFLAARAIPGVERVEGDTYHRTVSLDAVAGWLSVSHPSARALRVDVSTSLLPKLATVLARVRALFDVDARPDVIAEVLGADPLLAASVALRPGLRVPGAFDGFELAVRAILGQQVSVRGATTLAGRLVDLLGQPLETSVSGATHAFPAPAALARMAPAALARIGIPTTRAAALVDVARAVHEGRIELAPGVDVDRTRAALEAVRGVGAWTSAYVAMRALRDADAFVAGDLVVRRALGVTTARAAEERARGFRPWRAYAVLHLWTHATERAAS